MEIALASVVFIAAALCAATMGFAIQRGGTCTVAAIDELINERATTRLRALVEASLWVAGGLLVARAAHLLPQAPRGFAITGWTVLGGALLGFGAYVNRACVFGAIARLGSGEWSYLMTPLGFYVGCLTVGVVFKVPMSALAPGESLLLMASLWGALAFAAFAAWRLGRPLLAARRHPADAPFRTRLRNGIATHVWSPHAATSVIGITFVALFLLVGPWAYTDVLADASRDMAGHLAVRAALMVALLAGAVAGGITAGRFAAGRITAPQLARCFVGGVLMGWGSLLIPGGNDGLILIGMPLFQPYAWLAFATMCATVALPIFLGSALRHRAAEHDAA